MSDITALPGGIRLIDDMHRSRPHIIGTYLLPGDEPLLVDPGPTSTLAHLEAGLASAGLTLADIRAILLTHIHLDHAGATGTLVARYPHLQVYVHHRGAPHLVDPERLLKSARRLYGDGMDQLWGDVRAVPAQQLHVLSGGETLQLGQRTMQVYDAPGHASHHVMYVETESGAAFVGDVAGVLLPGTRSSRPPTPPPDIDLAAWQHSLDLVRDLDPSVLLLTHFGAVDQPREHIEDFRARLLHWAEVVRAGLASGMDEASQIRQLQALADSESGHAEQYQYAAPIDQSWQGLARYWRKRAEHEA